VLLSIFRPSKEGDEHGGPARCDAEVLHNLGRHRVDAYFWRRLTLLSNVLHDVVF